MTPATSVLSESARRLADVSTLGELALLLESVNRIASAERAPSIAAACKRLSAFADADRPDAFRLLMNTIWGLDVAHRGLVIQTFCRRLRPLPAASPRSGTGCKPAPDLSVKVGKPSVRTCAGTLHRCTAP
jgi:hypothetical protein